MPSISVVIWLVIPVIVLAVLRNVWLRHSENKRLRSQHPEEPWLWRRDWASGLAADRSFRYLNAVWAVAIILILLSVRAVLDGNVVVPVLGAIATGVALDRTLRRRKYGSSICSFDTLPIPLGGTLSGTIEVRSTQLPPDGFLLRLTNLRYRSRRHDRSAPAEESVMWEEEQRVAAAEAMRVANGIRVPFRFDLPAVDAEPADERNPDDRVIWRLDVQANVRGLDYWGLFELPVFGRADAQPLAETPWTPPETMTFATAAGDVEQVIVQSSLHRRLYIAAAVWVVAMIAAGIARGPLFLVFFLGLAGLVSAAGSLGFRLGNSVIAANENVLRYRHSIFGMRVVPAADVVAVEPRAGVNYGGRALYDVEARLENGEAVTIAWHLPSRRDAEMLARRIRKALGGR